MRRRSPIQSRPIPTTRGSAGFEHCDTRRDLAALSEFQENIVAIIANTIRRWRLEHAINDDEAEDDARLIVGSGPHDRADEFTRFPADKVDHFLRTLVRSTLRQ
jgi:hypothetical protein